MNGKKMILNYLLLLIFIGCQVNGEPTLEGVGTGVQPQTVTANSCSSSVIDTGQKGNIAATQRGSFNSVAIIPSSVNPAIAYYDTLTLGIKIIYWSGSTSYIETVTGETLGAGSDIKLVFLSSGVPLIFWVSAGTTVKMAARSAAFGTSGTWTSSIIETFAGGATRNLNASVNPLDEVAVFYIATNTAASARPRIILCTSNCYSSNNYIGNIMASTENIEATGAYNLVVSQVKTGLAWCGKDTDSDGSVDEYYPAVAYTGQASSARFAVCVQSNITNCLSAASWTKQNYDTTSNLAADLQLDHTIDGDVPKIAALKAAAGLRAYAMTGGGAGNKCYGTLGAFTASAANFTGSGVSSGNAYLQLFKNSSGWHVIANESTTAMRYYSTVGTSSTNITTNWTNTQGVINSAVTLPAASSGTMTSAFITSSNQIITAYPNTAAPFNMYMSVVADATVSPTASTQAYSNFYPDNTGAIQLATAQTQNTAIAATSDGRPGVAYIDNSAGTAATAKLKYAFRDGTASTDLWEWVLVPYLGATPMFPSIAYDHNNKPWISYFESNAANSRYYLVTNSSTDGTGSWTTYQFPTIPGGAYTAPATSETKVVMYKSGGISYPVMIVIDPTSGYLRSARLTPSTGAWSTVTNINSVVLAQDADYLDADFDSSGNIVVAFQDLTTSNIYVKYAYSANGGATWTTPQAITAVSGDGVGVSIKINPITSKPAVTFYNRANNLVYYVTCSGTLSGTCSTASTDWTKTSIGGATVGVSTVTATTLEKLLTTSLTFNSTGAPTVLYTEGTGTTVLNTANSLLLNTFTNPLSPSISTYIAGANTHAMTITPHLAGSGYNAASVRTSTGELVTVHLGPGNFLSQKACYP